MLAGLAARRDLLARRIFDQVPPLDFFSLVDGVLLWRRFLLYWAVRMLGWIPWRRNKSQINAFRARVLDEGSD